MFDQTGFYLILPNQILHWHKQAHFLLESFTSTCTLQKLIVKVH